MVAHPCAEGKIYAAVIPARCGASNPESRGALAVERLLHEIEGSTLMRRPDSRSSQDSSPIPVVND